MTERQLNIGWASEEIVFEWLSECQGGSHKAFLEEVAFHA
jgi:hypothetical protein